MKNTLLALVFALAFIGCTSRSDITSVPSGARLTVNGVDHGLTPVEAKLEYSNNWTQQHFKLEKEGYQTIEGTLEKRFYWTTLIVDCLYLPPLAFFNACGPQAHYDFVMTKSGAATGQKP